MQDFQEKKALKDTLNLPCPSCGSELHWSAKAKKIACDHCGYEEEFDHSKDKVVEKSLAEAASKVSDFVPEDGGKKVFECQNCGAKLMVESDQVDISCGFCGSENINLEAYQHRFIQPAGIVPFDISKEEAEEHFKAWIRKGWFHPNKLKQLATIDNLHGIYLPFWTFDTQSESDWSGEAGHYYYETQRVRINGKWQNQQVQKVRWVHRSGHLSHFFDDVLVVASGGLQQPDVERILPYRLEEIVNFDPRLVAGWESEIYILEVDKGYQVANRIMDAKIRNMCSSQLGGDTQRNLCIQSEKFNQKFKHIILPAWICSYAFKDKTYRFTINGQTGKVNGEKPVSWAKIVFLLLLFGLFIFAIYLLRQSGVV